MSDEQEHWGTKPSRIVPREILKRIGWYEYLKSAIEPYPKELVEAYRAKRRSDEHKEAR